MLSTSASGSHCLFAVFELLQRHVPANRWQDGMLETCVRDAQGCTVLGIDCITLGLNVVVLIKP
jgi:hypothetical protein